MFSWSGALGVFLCVLTCFGFSNPADEVPKCRKYNILFFVADTLTQGSSDIFASPDDINAPQRWLKFNDTVVEEVDMTDELLEQECFGGSYLAEVPGEYPTKNFAQIDL